MFIKPIHVMFLNFISLNFVISLELFHFSCNFYRYNNNEDFNFFRAGSIRYLPIMFYGVQVKFIRSNHANILVQKEQIIF